MQFKQKALFSLLRSKPAKPKKDATFGNFFSLFFPLEQKQKKAVGGLFYFFRLAFFLSRPYECSLFEKKTRHFLPSLLEHFTLEEKNEVFKKKKTAGEPGCFCWLCWLVDCVTREEKPKKAFC